MREALARLEGRNRESGLQKRKGKKCNLAFPAGSDFLLLTYISLLGSAASYGVFFLNASRGNLTALSSLTFSTPCFAAATCYLAFGETLTPLQLLGATVTLGGVIFINKTPTKKVE